MKYIKIYILVFLSHATFAQNITYNHIIDTTDFDTKEVMELFENYISSNPHNQVENPYWNLEDQKKHKQYDFLESEFQPSFYMGLPIHVLSINFNEDIAKIKAQFYQYQDGSLFVLAIANYIANKENGTYKLYNSLSVNRERWNKKTVGLVNFYYPAYHDFDDSKAKELNDFIDKYCHIFGVKPKPFEYYLADTYDEIQALKGFDYYLGMGGHNMPAGKSTDDKVYCGGLGEYYVHEVFHVQIDEHYPNKHFWVSEGIATYLGGSRGKNLEWHIKRTNDYLQKHPEINLNNLLSLKNLDNHTAYHYVLGGLIVKKIMEKGNWELLKVFMSSGISDDDYYAAIEEHLNVCRSDLDVYLRNQLQIEALK